MNKDLQRLDEILKNFPINPYVEGSGEFVLSNISVNDAALVWRYALQYLNIAKEVDSSYDWGVN